jgi:hypothetical protein
MKRRVLEKVVGGTDGEPQPLPAWHGEEDIIAKLCGPA